MDDGLENKKEQKFHGWHLMYRFRENEREREQETEKEYKKYERKREERR